MIVPYILFKAFTILIDLIMDHLDLLNGRVDFLGRCTISALASFTPKHLCPKLKRDWTVSWEMRGGFADSLKTVEVAFPALASCICSCL